MPGLIFLLLVIALLVSCALTLGLVRLGNRLRTLDTPGAPGHDKVEVRSVPNIGGVAIWFPPALLLLAGVLAAGACPWLLDHLPWEVRTASLAGHVPEALALLLCMTAIHVLGLVDDRRSISPWIKLLVQCALAGVLATWFDVRLMTLFGPVPSILLAVLWIVAITNAINFLDNMDGLAGGVSVITGGMLLLTTAMNGQWGIAVLLAVFLGGVLGFLLLNFPPARIFMGDGGSLFCGFFLAVLAIRTTFYGTPPGSDVVSSAAWFSVFTPIVIFAIPLYDLIVVSQLRLRQGKSPFVGDRQHFSHRLVERGLSTRSAVILVWALTAVMGIGGIALGHLAPWQAILVGVQAVLVLMTIGLLEHVTDRKDEPE